ncbi:MAG: CDP-diacylglycerol--glycerol-3-phosphate 3-phosphatidyltransferase [Balneolaceae bacterium]|nr:CDP-diacylglycerol--glycerol-3-phosphate 3-phosphatidyltransferase [Balneolaceae bacterium]MBO6547702.1 CDP-diacylglycerol--glycerol-3-phosphate 3-phosphatidyltransferase [Balneolaceae bacterium]MBO6648213.1 CDP-diacylglycerol--glycerol-3-phosphate 3-phosphatidyltransferase [Balneolaceae bacterium]
MHRLPNILSSVRIILSPIFLLLWFQDEFLLKALGLAIYIIAAVTDYFDGYYARKFAVESKLGNFLDPLADKFLTFSGFIVLPFIDAEQFPWWAIGVIIFRDVVITIFRIYTNRKEQPMVTRFTAKAKTTIQMIFLYIGLVVGLFQNVEFFAGDWVRLILQTDILLYLMIFVASVTLYSGLEYIVVNRMVFKSED